MTTIVPGSLEAAVFGTDDPDTVVARLGELAVVATGAGIAELRWYVPSVSCVAGVLLADGRTAVLRAYQPSVTDRFARGVVRVQRLVADAGFPAPEPLSDPIRLAWGLGRVEALLEDPGMRYPAPAALAVSATALAHLADLVDGVDHDGLDEHPMLQLRGLYPTPHSPIFDFEATAEGAEWIDEIAAAAAAVLVAERAPSVIAHTDWSSRNIRIDGDRVVAAYDWESMSSTTEARALGVAAATWRALGHADDPIAPGADELAAYVDAYAAHRPLTSEQRRLALAKAVHGMAYTARCEHALRPGDRSGRASARLPDLAPLVSPGTATR